MSTPTTAGVIVLLENPAVPGLCFVRALEACQLKGHLENLNALPHVPSRFVQAGAFYVQDLDQVARALAEAFQDFRPHPAKSFYRLDPDRIAWKIYQLTDPMGRTAEGGA